MKVTNKIYKNLNLAHEDNRADNFGIDLSISSSIGVLIAYLTYTSFGYAVLIYFLVRFCYYFCFEFYLGRTLGKFQTQTKVVTINGEKPTILQLIKRNISRFFSLISGVSDKERAIHDILSNTFVVKDLGLKKINIKQLLLLVFNLLVCGYWIYLHLSEPQLKDIDIIVVLILSLTFIYGLFILIKKIKNS